MTSPPAVGTSARRFRAAMARVCTPVTVVTVFDGGRPHGTTVSAFMSLSMSPALIAVALDSTSDLLDIVKSTGAFGVNVLGAGRAGLAIEFARKGRDKFDGVAWQRCGDLPRLDGTSVWLRCSVADALPGGDHVILVGNVVEAEHVETPPLTYHDRTFGTHHADDHAADAR